MAQKGCSPMIIYFMKNVQNNLSVLDIYRVFQKQLYDFESLY
jgi:hypothetical protein